MTPQDAQLFRSLLKTISIIDRDKDGLNTDDLLDVCEKVSPSKFMKTGGSLFETYIIIYGSERDSSIISTEYQLRKRARYQRKSSGNETEINRMIKQYALRFGLLKLVF